MENEKINSRKLKAIETKNKLFKASEKLFEKYGFEEVSIDSIVKTAGVSKGTFYVHFNSKDALIAELTANYVNNLDLEYQSFLDSFGLGTRASDILISLTEKIFDIIINYVGYDMMRVVYGVQLSKTVNMDSVMGYNRKLYKLLNDLINLGADQGEFRRDITSETITKHCMLAYRGLTYEWLIRYPKYDLQKQAQKHMEIFLLGIKKK